MTVQSSILPPPLAKYLAHAKPCTSEGKAGEVGACHAGASGAAKTLRQRDPRVCGARHAGLGRGMQGQGRPCKGRRGIRGVRAARIPRVNRGMQDVIGCVVLNYYRMKCPKNKCSVKKTFVYELWHVCVRYPHLAHTLRLQRQFSHPPHQLIFPACTF